MSTVTKQPRRARRIWQAPLSRMAWLCLLLCALLYGSIYLWFLSATSGQSFAGPFSEPLRSFGIVAFLLVLLASSYTLRRRFLKALPGRTQDWLWMHTSVGVTALLVALLHENYANVLHDYCTNLQCFTQAAGGMSALYAVIVLVVSGLFGRVLDFSQTRIIAREAGKSGGGIARAVEGYLLELEYVLERLSAGKSALFKRFTSDAIAHHGRQAANGPDVPAHESADLQRVRQSLVEYARLVHSLHRQRRAMSTMRVWRIVHSCIASVAFALILFHASAELLTTVWHIHM